MIYAILTIAALALGAIVGHIYGRSVPARQIAELQVTIDNLEVDAQNRSAKYIRMEADCYAQLTRAQSAADNWKVQAETLVTQNTRLLDEVAAARLQLGDSADKILAAFTSGTPGGDTGSEQAGTSPEQLMDAALTAAFDLDEPDWTENLPYTGGTPSPTTEPPEVVAHIQPAEGGN